MSTQTPLNDQQIIDLLLDLDETIADLRHRFRPLQNHKESDSHSRVVKTVQQLRNRKEGKQ